MNDLKRNKHFPENIASNLKFLNNLQPEWKRHVTIVRQTKNLHETDFTQIYDFLKMNQEKVNELRAEPLAKSHDPLALMAHSQNSFNFSTTHKDQSSSSTHPQQSFPINNKTSSNPRNHQIAQPVMNMGQDRQIQNVRGNGRNQFGQFAGQVAQNQQGFNAWWDSRPRRRDAAYLQTQLLIAQKEKAGIQLQAKEFDYMAAAGDLDEIEEVNANCISMANLQQASTSEQYTDLHEPIPEPQLVPQNDNHVTFVAPSMVQSVGTVETSSAPNEEIRAHQETVYRNLVDQVAQVDMVTRNMRAPNAELKSELARYKIQEQRVEISQEKYDKLEKCYQKSVYQERCLTRKINALHLSSAKQITTLNDEISYLNKQLSKEKSSISSLMDEKKKLKHDFKIREDKFLNKEVDLKARIKDLENILLKRNQTVQNMHMLNPKPDSFYHPNQKMALSYPNPSYLKKAQLKQQSLYNGNLLLEEHDPPAVYDSEETLEFAQESREKIRLLKKEIKPANYAKINHLSGVFVPQTTKSKKELFLSNVSNMVTTSKTISIPNEDLSDDTTPSVARKFLNEIKSSLVTLQHVVKQKMTLEVHNWSSSAHKEVHRIISHEIAPIINQVDARVQNFKIQFLQEAAKFIRDFKSLTKEADESLNKQKFLELEIERLLKASVSHDIMSIVQNGFVDVPFNLQTELDRTKEKLELCIVKKEKEYDVLWYNWYIKCEECKYDKISYDKAYNDMQQKVERLQAQLRDLKGKSSDAPSASNTLDPLNQKEFNVVKHRNVIASGMFKINPSQTPRVDLVPNKQSSVSIRINPITKSHRHVTFKEKVSSDTVTASSTGLVNTARTRRPQPKGNTRNARIPSASKSSEVKKIVNVEDHRKTLLLSKNQKTMSSECNNIKLAIRNDKSKIVCNTYKQCLVTANHDGCLPSFVNALNSHTNKLCVNVPPSANQKRHMTQVWKPKQVGSKERLAPKPRLPRFSLKWSPSRRSFDLKGKLVTSKETNCPNDDKACCSKHMTGNIKLLINFVWKFLGTVRFGNDHIAAILGYGDLKWENITITKVYFIEGLGHNLFSVGQFCDADLEVAFRRNTCFIRDLDGVDLLKGNRSTNLYTINLHEMASASPICLMAHVTPTKSWLWHQRLSHLNFDTINDLAKNDLVSGLPKFKYAKNIFVPLVSKKRAKKPLTHPNRFRIQSSGFICFIWICVVQCELQELMAPVIIVRTDNGTEFKNQVLKKYFNSIGISHETSTAKTPQKNRVVERRNRTLVEAARTMLIFSHASLFLWAKAIATAMIVKISTNGYSANYVTYRVYNRRTKKIIESMNITFDELSAMAFEQNSSRPGLQSMTYGQISSELELTYAPSTITPQRPSEHDLDILFEPLHNEYLDGRPAEAPRAILAVPVLQNLQAPNASMSFQDSTPVPSDSSNTLVSSHNVDATSQQHAQQQRNLTQSPTTSAADNVLNVVFEGDLFVNPFGTPSTDIMEPKTIKEALTDPAWIESMQEELHQFSRLEVWELVPSADGIKPLTLKWLFNVTPPKMFRSEILSGGVTS
uniref:Integrase, catalytic region, zinc finger, CCHC-type, peptidase aspartic, catalytic n=1 Tax=Tanacetum cinerariifolium TaxID=118510 RepID=A0A699GQD3_TANCI|nr:integrase, catalytic region, zinc finger, CCHC-type, peptidase aspartic, catalytic [Tanacetum cinerariifolium]